VVGYTSSGTGVTGQSGSGDGVYGFSKSRYGVHGYSDNQVGVYGESNNFDGLWGVARATGKIGVTGKSFGNLGVGVYGYSEYGAAGFFEGGAACCNSAGVRVKNVGGAVGLWASTSDANAAVYGQGAGSGVVGEATANGGVGVLGRLGAGVTSGYAGQFFGNVQITGNLTKGGGSFKIDHPLDPANKYLYHSFVESPDMLNIYNGNITTDANGEAVIQLPDWFEALNQDFRYQLTPIGQFAQVIVLKEVANNQFTIKTDKPNVKVSWQVTGIRHDPYANAHRIPVEENKPADERGKYLYPDLYGQPESQSIIQQLGQQAVQVTDPISKTERQR
jgi:trimeric autotransporter adhesin